MNCDELKTRLEPYVDSQLAPNELAALESHLRECSACSATALGLLQMKLKTRAAAAARYTPSPEFRLRMENAIRAKQKRSWFSLRIPRLAMAGAFAAILLASTLLWMNYAQRDRAVSELADLHVAALASTNPVDVVSTDRHTVKPWFAGKVPFTFNIPELQNTDFKLEGGRVTYFQHKAGAQLLFTLRKHQFSVFIFEEPSGIGPVGWGTSTRSKLQFHSETWSEGGLRYFIISDATASDVHALSVLLRNAAHS